MRWITAATRIAAPSSSRPTKPWPIWPPRRASSRLEPVANSHAVDRSDARARSSNGDLSVGGRLFVDTLLLRSRRRRQAMSALRRLSAARKRLCRERSTDPSLRSATLIRQSEDLAHHKSERWTSQVRRTHRSSYEAIGLQRTHVQAPSSNGFDGKPLRP